MSLVSFCCTGLVVFSAWSCGGPRPTAFVGDWQQSLAADVDRSRAFIPFTNVPPSLTLPAKPPEWKPISERGARQISAAKLLIDQQRYTEAIAELDRGMRLDANHPDLHRALAMAHWSAGNTVRARDHAERALAANPDDSGAHFLMGKIFQSENEAAKSLRSYRMATLCTDFGSDKTIEAWTLFSLGEALAAEGYLSAALELHPVFRKAAEGAAAASPEVALTFKSALRTSAESQSVLLERLGRFDEAAAALSLAISADASLERSVRFARLLMSAGRLEAALSAARSIESVDPLVMSLLEEIHQRRGRPEGIIEDYQLRQASRPDDADLVLSHAKVLRRLGQVAESAAVLGRFVEAHPTHSTLRLDWLAALCLKGDWEEGLRVAAEGIRKSPTSISAIEGAWREAILRSEESNGLLLGAKTDDAVEQFYLRSIVAAVRNLTDREEEFLGESLRRNPDFAAARAALAEIHFRKLEYGEVLRVAGRRVEQIAEDARLERILGRTYERLDKADLATLHWKAALQLDPGDVKTMLDLARLYRLADDALTAQRQLRLLLDVDPRNDEARELLALIYLNEQKIDAAHEQFEELHKRSESLTANARATAMQKVIVERDPEAYRKRLREAMSSSSPDAPTWLAVGDSYSEFEQSLAAEAYTQALQLDSNNEEAALGLVFALQRTLQWNAAADRFASLLARRPNRASWRLGFGDSSWRMGQLELRMAMQDYSAALQLAQEQSRRSDLDAVTQTRYRIAIVDCLREMKRNDDVVARMKEWSGLETQETRGWSMRLGREFLRIERTTEALAIFEDLHKTSTKPEASLDELVDALTAAGKFDRAVQHLLDRLSSDPDNDSALAAIVVLMARQERYNDGLELVRSRLLRAQDRERFQDAQMVLLNLGKRHLEAADYLETLLHEAQAILRTSQQPAVRRPPVRPRGEKTGLLPNEPFQPSRIVDRIHDLRIRMAGQLSAAGRHKEAEMQLRSWIESLEDDPNSRVGYLLSLAGVVRRNGRESESFPFLEQALAIQPDSVGLSNDVAYGWIDRGEKLTEARRLIEYALSRSPRQTAYLDTYGWLLYKEGRFADARTWLERAVGSTDPPDPVLLDHLGDACWRSGQRQEAIGHWKRAVEGFASTKNSDLSDDEKRVRDRTQQGKISPAESGAEPEAAPFVTTGDAKPSGPSGK